MPTDPTRQAAPTPPDSLGELPTSTQPPADPPTVTGEAVRAIDDLLTHHFSTPPAPTAPPDPPPGFAIERELGGGGMGVVYLARQMGLNRPVALKLVRAGSTSDSRALIRFLAEAEAVAVVKHPNVVEVYSYGDHRGRPYMALEYCPGGDLTALRHPDRQGGTPRDAAHFRRVAGLMAGVAAGVQAAHAKGVVHRDLKPHNVLLTADGTPKVADFGLAKRGGGADLTQSHAVLGTPAYMAPEQAGGGGKFVGPEADVWALGVMLYELVCGERPFDAPTTLELVTKVLAAEVPPLKGKCPTVPADLALVVHKCLSRDPRDRYPTAGGLAADLVHWLDGKPISARPAGVVEQATKWARRNKKLAGMGVAVLLTMAVASGVSLGFGLEANRQAGRANARQKDAEDAAALTRRTAGELAAALGEKTTAEADARSKADALDAQLTETRRLLDLARLREADAAFDRANVQVMRDKLAAVPAANRCLAWGLLHHLSDGSALALRGHTEAVEAIAFSPDGRMVATGSADQTARLWDATSGRLVRELKGHTDGVSGLAFSPDDTRVVTGSGDGTARVWKVATGEVVKKLTGHTDGVSNVAFSPDGKLVATASFDQTIRVWDLATGESRHTLTGHAGRVWGVAFSPDGGRLVSGSDDKTVRVWDAAAGKPLTEMTGHTHLVMGVGFSPDGQRVVSGSVDGTARIWDAGTGKSLVVKLPRDRGQ